MLLVVDHQQSNQHQWVSRKLGTLLKIVPSFEVLPGNFEKKRVEKSLVFSASEGHPKGILTASWHFGTEDFLHYSRNVVDERRAELYK